MRINSEGWNIVLAGSWNRAIFTPEWVSQHVLEGEGDLETLLSIMPHFPLVYQRPTVSLEVHPNRIIIRPRIQINAAAMVLIESIAHKVISKLPNTPIAGIGFNLSYIEPSPSPELLGLFNVSDTAELVAHGWGLSERRWARRLTKDDDSLNLSLVFDETKIKCDFNFHSEATEPEQALAAVSNRAQRICDTSLQILNDVYHLQLLEEQEDNE